jgi:hypothetical protein
MQESKNKGEEKFLDTHQIPPPPSPPLPKIETRHPATQLHTHPPNEKRV